MAILQKSGLSKLWSFLWSKFYQHYLPFMTEYGGGRTEGSAGRRGRQLGRLPRYGEGRAGLVAAELLPRVLGLLGGVTPGAEGVGGEGRGEGAGGGAQREAGPRGHGAAAAAHRARLVVACLQTAAMVTWKNVQVTKYLNISTKSKVPRR